LVQDTPGSPRQPAALRPARVYLFLALMATLVLAFLLRVWGVRFGFPYVYHYDEPTYVRIALDLGRGVVGEQPNPTGFSNILFGQYAAWYGLGALVGESASELTVAESWPAHPTFAAILLGRITSAFLGTLTVAVVYRLGRLLSGRTVGLLGASFLAVAFLHVRGSHYTVPDVAATFLVSGAVLLAALAIRQGRRQLVCLSAAIAGLAVATKWTAAPVILAPSLAAIQVFGMLGERRPRLSGVAFGLLAASSLFAVGFVAGGFEVLLEPRRYWDYLLLEYRAGAAGGFWIWQVDTVSGWLFYLKTLTYGLGALPLAMALAGLARRLLMAFRTRDRTSILALSFVLPYFIAVGSTRHYFARYALPLIPFLALFAAETVSLLARWLSSRLRVAKASIVATLVVLVIVQPLAASIWHGVLLTRTDTRTLAKNWIESRIPAGAKLALDWPVYSPPLSRELYTVREQGRIGLAKHSLDWYRDEGFDYIVTSNFVYGLSLLDPDQATARSAFYASLDDELELLTEISPYVGAARLPIIFEEIYGPATNLWQRLRPGPVLRIYRVR